MNAKLEELRDAVAGEEITAITFIHDYFQLACRDVGMTFYAPPQVRRPGSTVPFEAAGFADAARQLLGVQILECRLDENGMMLRMQDGSELSLTFDEGELNRAGEGVVIQHADGRIWIAP